MMYVVAIFLPPIAVLLCGKPFQAIINVLLCLTVLGGPLHALFVVHGCKSKERHVQLVAAITSAGQRR